MDNELIAKAIEIAKENSGNFGMSLLQRRMKLGCIKCSKLLEELENRGIIGPYNPENTLRTVLIK